MGRVEEDTFQPKIAEAKKIKKIINSDTDWKMVEKVKKSTFMWMIILV